MKMDNSDDDEEPVSLEEEEYYYTIEKDPDEYEPSSSLNISNEDSLSEE